MWWLAIKSDLLDLACDPFIFDKLHRTYQRERHSTSNGSNGDNGMPSQQNKRASYIFIIPGVCAFVVIFSLIPKNRLLHHSSSLSYSHTFSSPTSPTYSVCVSFWYVCSILIIDGYYSSGSLYEIIYMKHTAWEHHRYTNAQKTWKWHKNKDSFTKFCHDNKVWLRKKYTIFGVVLGFMTIFSDLLLLQHLYDLAQP